MFQIRSSCRRFVESPTSVFSMTGRGSIHPAGTIILNRLAGSSVPRGCTVVAQRFSFFHGISRDLRALVSFHVVLVCRDHIHGGTGKRKAKSNMWPSMRLQTKLRR